MSCTERQYLTNGELREEIAYAVGADPTRYGADSQKGLTKADVRAVCESLQPDSSDLELRECTLEPLYRHACEWAGGEYSPNAGNPWKLNRENLKHIHAAVGGRSPREQPVTDGGIERPVHPRVALSFGLAMFGAGLTIGAVGAALLLFGVVG